MSILTTNIKIAGVLIIDDTFSMNTSAYDISSDDSIKLLTKKNKVKHLINQLFDRVQDEAYIDLWIYGRDIVNLSNGFTNNRTALLNYVESFYNSGLESSMNETSLRAISGLNYQSLIEARYGANHTVSTADIEWARSFIPTIFLVSDGNNSDTTETSDIAIAANSAWDDQGIPIYILGWGKAKEFDNLRTLADTTSGLFFNISNITTYTSCQISDSADTVSTVATPLVEVGDNIMFLETNGIIRSDIIYNVDFIDGLTFTISDDSTSTPIDVDVAHNNSFCIVDDWLASIYTLFHGEVNSIFKADWFYTKDFPEQKWIKKISVSYSLQQASYCDIYVRYTKDRFSWSNWIKLSSGIDYYIDDLIYSLDFKATLKDGWINNTATHASILSLSYTEIEPFRKYYITSAEDIDGMLFEYIMSASLDLPKSSKLRWGICRGDSTDFSDYEIIFNDRKGVLANRQYHVRYIDGESQENLAVTSISTNKYQVYAKNGTLANWNDNTDSVLVFISSSPVSISDYSTYGGEGQIIFGNNIDLTGITNSDITVSIFEPTTVNSYYGEPTYTYDYKTYYSRNGKWNSDATVLVLVNNLLVRQNYWLDSTSGIVTFNRELEPTDIVCLYILHSGKFRVGLEVTSYDETNLVTLNNLGLYFTEITNSSLLTLYANAPIPQLISDPILNCNNNSVYSRMTVEYTFKEVQGMQEKDSLITWYQNGVAIPDYNRMIQPLVEVWDINDTPQAKAAKRFQPGDEVYVTVQPSDGLTDTTLVSTYESAHIVLVDDYIPSVSSLTFSTSSQISYQSVTISGNYFTTLNAHGLTSKQAIGFVGDMGNSGIIIGRIYFVLLDTTNTARFQITESQDSDTPKTIGMGATNVKYYKRNIDVSVGESVSANFVFYDPANPSDSEGADSIINWYSNENTNSVFYEGKIIPADMTTKNTSLFYIVTPKNGDISGNPVSSGLVNVGNT